MKTQIRATLILIIAILLVTVVVPDVGAQSLEGRVQSLERQVDRLATTSLVLFLYGVFCALWAQRTNRSAWGWFFLGLFFGPFTTIVLLSKNAQDKTIR
jgi:hypothetical protein